MSRLRLHAEHHLVGRIGWLRAAVLGANDGIISTAQIDVLSRVDASMAQTYAGRTGLSTAKVGELKL
jgi:VIT1/CCC1 family predicted Fe2+/Mn2+ transporter